MTTETGRLAELAARVVRQRRVAGALIVGVLVLTGVALSQSVAPVAVRLAVGLGVLVLGGWLLRRTRLDGAASATDYARHLDAIEPSLQDSCELLLRDRSQLTGLAALAHERAASQFQALDQDGGLASTLPPFPWSYVAAAGGTAAVVSTLSLLWSATETVDDRDSIVRPRIASATVTLAPPAYLDLANSRTRQLDFSTVENAQVQWRLELDRSAEQVALLFHDGERLALTGASSRRWESSSWSARSTVYQVMVDGEETPISVHRIDAIVDQAPVLTVESPDVSLLTLAADADSAQLALTFRAQDDHRVVGAVAKVTLARGSGEQVRFREQDFPLDVTFSDDARSISVDQSIDLIELGMTPGDELYLFAQVTDNEPNEPNIGVSSTFIVRWPGEDADAELTKATVAVSVLPEFFRSQRQIIIDTEKLLRDRPKLEESEFAQLAQTLAIDQKLLRLRYGQYLGEEDDSGIGAGATRPVATDDDDHDENEEEHEDHDEHEAHEEQQQYDLHDEHDHAGHADESFPSDKPVTGDADAAIAPYAHFHDRAEQSSLFDLNTIQLLRAALSNMWDAELQLRLAQPQPALPFEYEALKYIKAVQQGPRIYLRRAGFRPTPIDEARRLTGDLDEIVERPVEHSVASAGEQQQMRELASELVRVVPSAERIDETLAALVPGIRTRAASEATWLPLLEALQRFDADRLCADCRTQLVAALWRSLTPTLATPGAVDAAPHPVEEAYRQRQTQVKSP
ncbi:MAG: hypothetical protein AB8G17_06445 [Gammaproteobacteria bacterium]